MIELNSDGFRVVAVAYKVGDSTKEAYTIADESDLTLVGYIAFLDPPKESAGPAIATLGRSGIRVKILTGDNDIVTRKICHEVGFEVDRIVLGSELDGLDEEALAGIVESNSVFAKISPAQKARIIAACQRNNHVVGFLDAGINDSSALKTADVGVSVDTAVDIAKESADIILLEKSLAVLGEGVIEGRRIFGNITNTSRWERVRISAICSVLSARASCGLSCRWRRSRCLPIICSTTFRRRRSRLTTSTMITYGSRVAGTSITS